MKKTIYLFALLPFLIACNQIENTTNVKETASTENNEIVNALLPSMTIVYNEVNYKKQANTEWTKGVDSLFMANLNKDILNSNIPLYEAASGEYIIEDRIKTDANKVRSNIRKDGEISAIYFTEAWSFDSTNYKLDKKVLKWSPVISYYKSVGNKISSEKTKRLLYDVTTSFEGNEKLIASNITYEINFNSKLKTNDWLNLEKLATLVINPVLEGKHKAYDFFDKTPIKLDNIKINLGYGVDSIEEEDPVTGEWKWLYHTNEIRLDEVYAYIFVEDWYIDTKTFAIKKKIKTIAPVRLYMKSYNDSALSKKVIFAVDM